MNKFTEKLFATKTVSVWGIGYLGYTTVLRLQSKGFFVNCSTFEKDVQKDIQTGQYPYEHMKQTWSLHNEIPKIDLEKIIFSHDYTEMFDSNVHIIALPGFKNDSGKAETYYKLIDIFSKNIDKLNGSLILFQSAEKAGTVKTYFINPLKKAGAQCHFASAFRSDWSIEEFLLGNEVRIIGSNDKQSLEIASQFFNIMEINFQILDGIEEAEIYENGKNCLKYSVEAFFTQLSFAYPNININEVSAMIIKNLELPSKRSGLNLLNHKNMLHIDHLLAGQHGEHLSIVKETQAINMNAVLFYADILKHNKITSISIMGMSVKGARKDIRASAAILLAEYLNTIGLDVFVHDPYFTPDEIQRLLPFAKPCTFDTRCTKTDGYVIMSSNPVYHYFTQHDIQQYGLYDAKIIIDSIGTFKHFLFSSQTKYHEVGDGRLKALIK